MATGGAGRPRPACVPRRRCRPRSHQRWQRAPLVAQPAGIMDDDAWNAGAAGSGPQCRRTPPRGGVGDGRGGTPRGPGAPAVCAAARGSRRGGSGAAGDGGTTHAGGGGVIVPATRVPHAAHTHGDLREWPGGGGSTEQPSSSPL